MAKDSVRITDDAALPLAYCKIGARVDGVLWETVVANLPEGLVEALEACVEGRTPNNEAIKAAALRREEVSGAEVRRGCHLRVA